MRRSQPVFELTRRKSRVLRLVLVVFAVGLVLVLGSVFILGKFNPGSDQVTLTYTTEQGVASSTGILDSPLTVAVRIPWQTGSQDTILSAVYLELLDENGKSASFGPSKDVPLRMKPTLDFMVWNYVGSVPSKPGRYHARIQIQRLYGNHPLESVELREPIMTAVEDTQQPLRTGYLYNNESNLWLTSADAMRSRRLTFLDPGEELASEPSWSHDGSRIAYTFSPKTAKNEIPRTEIWVTTADGTDPQPLVPRVGSESLSYPYWTDDGKYLYFTVETPIVDNSSGMEIGQSRRIDRLELATGTRSQVASDGSIPSTGQNSDDLLYVQDVQSLSSGLGFATQRLVRGSVDGSTLQTLVDNQRFLGLYGPRLSPDGRWVVFSGAVPSEGGSRQKQLDLLGWLLFEPVVASAHDIPWEVYLVSSTGGPVTKLTELSEDQPHPVWIDNSTIAFIGLKGLYKLNIDNQGAPVGGPSRLRDGARHSALSWYAP